MQLAFLVVIGLLPLAAVAIPVPASAFSSASATSFANEPGTGLSYAQSFASSGSNAAAGAQAGAAAYGANPFLNGQYNSLSTSSAGGFSGFNSGLAPSTQNSGAGQSLGSGNAAACGQLVDASNNDAAIGTFQNSYSQGSDALANAGAIQNQGSNGNSGIENQSGRILHYAQSGPVIHLVTTGNDNNVEAAGNNQGTGSTNVANAVANQGQAGNQFSQGTGNCGQQNIRPNQQLTNAEANALSTAYANSLGLNNGADNASQVSGGLNTHSGSFNLMPNNGYGGRQQINYVQNSDSNSSSSSSHSESKTSSSSNMSSNTFNFSNVF